MSVVVWDGKTLAADRQATCGDLRMETSKMRKLSSGAIVAWTGSINCGLALAKWYESGAAPSEWPDFQKGDKWSRLVVVEGGEAFTYEDLPIPIPVLGLFAAWGSGSDFALGALALGADARRAVEIASRFCVSCGMGVDALDAA